MAEKTETKKKVSVKHLQIDKSQSTMLGVIAGAVVIVIFSLFATKSMVSKGLYQKHALKARQDVVATLKSNYNSAQTLFTQYKVFADQDPNILGGSAAGNTNLDGSNAVIVLDALPSSYDAPALASSIEKIMKGRNITINSLSVTDDPSISSVQSESQPQPKSVTFSFQGTTTFPIGTQLLQDFERSIRPFDLNTLEVTGSDNQLKMTVGMTTWFQPAKSLNLQATKEVE